MQDPNFSKLFTGDIPSTLEELFLAFQGSNVCRPLYFILRATSGTAFYTYSFTSEEIKIQLLAAMLAAIETVHSELVGNPRMRPTYSYGNFYILNYQIDHFYIATLLQQSSANDSVLQRILFGIEAGVQLPEPPVYSFDENLVVQLNNILSQYAK